MSMPIQPIPSPSTKSAWSGILSCKDVSNGEFKRGEAPLLKILSPFPFERGRGIKGDGVIINHIALHCLQHI